jgi:hypothetical protein
MAYADIHVPASIFEVDDAELEWTDPDVSTLPPPCSLARSHAHQNTFDFVHLRNGIGHPGLRSRSPC